MDIKRHCHFSQCWVRWQTQMWTVVHIFFILICLFLRQYKWFRWWKSFWTELKANINCCCLNNHFYFYRILIDFGRVGQRTYFQAGFVEKMGLTCLFMVARLLWAAFAFPAPRNCHQQQPAWDWGPRWGLCCQRGMGMGRRRGLSKFDIYTLCSESSTGHSLPRFCMIYGSP